ncbi:hypothetical protein EVAR_65002_1 [Eumeta japonica]|uniref:Uncharacterized protein n=1 Tax=Eumeta variegata TaxID=151549 RepID=A0A4C1S815_EUMVA|nr:hypothetical protein EVAR_65002_1 [Eumeta japonica]
MISTLCDCLTRDHRGLELSALVFRIKFNYIKPPHSSARSAPKEGYKVYSPTFSIANRVSFESVICGERPHGDLCHYVTSVKVTSGFKRDLRNTTRSGNGSTASLVETITTGEERFLSDDHELDVRASTGPTSWTAVLVKVAGHRS